MSHIVSAPFLFLFLREVDREILGPWNLVDNTRIRARSKSRGRGEQRRTSCFGRQRLTWHSSRDRGAGKEPPRWRLPQREPPLNAMPTPQDQRPARLGGP